MTRRYLLKLAAGKTQQQQQQQTPYRYVSPVAKQIAMQFNIPPIYLDTRNMGPALRLATKSIINGNTGFIGKTPNFIGKTASSTATPKVDKGLARIMKKPYYWGLGYPGATDMFAWQHRLEGDNIPGTGENFDSLAKFKDIGSTNFMGGGRNGGGSPVQG